MPDKVDKLYDDLKSQGYLEKDREHFRKFFFAPGNQGYTNRKALYDDLKGQGYLDSPTYEDFRDRLGLKAVKPTKATAVNSSRTTPTNRTTPTRSQVGSTGQQTILDVESKKTILPSGFGDLNPEAGLPEYMREEAKKRREASYGTNPAAMQQRRRTEQTFKAVRGDQQAAKEVGLDRVNQQLRDRMDYTMATGEELKMPDDGIDYNAIGIAPTVARDEEGNVVTGEDGRPLVGMTTDEVRANTQRVEQERVYQEDLQRQIDEANAELARLQEEAQKIETPDFVFGQDALSPYADPRTTNSDLAAISAARRQTEERIKALQEEMQGGRHGFFSGMMDAAQDSSTWMLGLDKAGDNLNMLAVSEKVKKGQPLTQAEQTMLDATIANNEVQQRLDEDSDWLYRTGRMTTEMVPFMGQIMLTGGYGSIAAVGERMGQKWATAYARKFGEKALLNRINMNMLRGFGIGMGDVAAGFASANTTGAVNTMNDALQRRIGQLGYDDEGDYAFTNDEDWLRAILKAEVSQTKEFATERFGEHIPGLRRLNVMLAKQGPRARAIARALSGFAGTKAVQKTAQWLRKGGVNGVFGEVLEEEIGLPVDVAIGDMTWEDALSGKTQWDIVGGMIMSIGAMHSVGLVAQGVGKNYNTAQYYRYKRAAEKASSAASYRMSSDKWTPLKERIDRTTSEDMSALWDEIREDGNYDVSEKRAAYDYINALTLMRGYNMGMLFSAREAAKEGRLTPGKTTPEEAVEMSVLTSGDEGYEAEGPERNEVLKRYEAALQAVAEVLGIDEEEVDSRLGVDELGENAIVDKALQVSFGEQVLEYLNARAAYNGMLDRVGDDIEAQVQASNEEVRRITNEAGQVVGATMKADGSQVYVVSGDLQTDDTIVVRNAETGELKMIAPDALESIEEPIDAEELRRQREEEITNTTMQQAENEIEGKRQFQPNDVVTLADGRQGQLGPLTPEGTFLLYTDDNKVVPISNDELNELATSVNGTPLEPATVSQQTEQEGEDTENAENYAQNEGENIPEEEATAEEQQQTEQEAEDTNEQPVVDADAMPMVGEGEDAEPDFSRAEPARAHRFIYDEAGLSRDEADQFVDANKKEADSALAKLQKKQPKIGTSLAKYRKEQSAWQQQVGEAQRQVDYWANIQSIQKERERAEQELVFQERQEEATGRQSLLDEQRDLQAKLAVAKKMYGDYFDDDLTMPHDVMELVALNMPRNISWEGREGVRGLQQELGLKRGVGRNADSNAFNSYLAKKGEGIGVEQAVHNIWESAMNELPNGDKRYDDSEIRNALLDMFMSAEKPSDIRDYVLNARIAEAEATRAAEDEAMRAAELDAWADAYHLTPEEREDFEDYISSTGEEISRMTDDEIQNIITIFAEQELNRVNDEQNRRSTGLDREPDKGRASSEVEGGEREIFEQGSSEDGGPLAERREVGSGDEVVPGDNVSGRAQVSKSSIQGLERYSTSEVLDIVRDEVQSRLDEAGLDGVSIKDMALHGSRMRGDAHEESDLDVVVEYEGNISEDGLFNILNEEPIEIDGVTVDVNPITKYKSGTLEQYMKRSDAYDAEVMAQQTENELGATSSAEEIAAQEAQVDTNPTEAQKEAGNYQKGHIKVDGFDITIENPKGSVRRGTDASGQPWEVTMNNTYGYIRGTEGVDGDHIDVFLSDDPAQSNKVFIVQQRVKVDGAWKFDELKVLMGFNSASDASNAYLSNYEKGWEGMQALIETDIDSFKDWLKNGNQKGTYKEDGAWVKIYPGVSNMVANEGEMPKPEQQKVQVLWGERDNSLPRMGRELPEVPGGRRKTTISQGNTGQNRREQGLLQGELQMDGLDNPITEPEDSPLSDLQRTNDVNAAVGGENGTSAEENKSKNPELPLERGESTGNPGRNQGQLQNDNISGKNDENVGLGEGTPSQLQNAEEQAKTGLDNGTDSPNTDEHSSNGKLLTHVRQQTEQREEPKRADGRGPLDLFAEAERIVAREEERQREPQPIGVGDFGNIYDQFRGKPKEAIEFLMKKRGGEAVGALSHKDVGEIDLVWGEEGTGKSDGFGLAKLVKYHPEVLDNLQEILDDMHVVKRTENRINLESDTHRAAVRLTWNEKKKNWLLTAFEKKNSALDNTTDTDETSERGRRNDTATPQSTVSEDKDTNKTSNKQEKVKKNTADEKIEDVGEVIAGARKDMSRKLAQAIDNATMQTLTELPFSKAYKKPDLKKAVEEGALREKDAVFYEAWFSTMVNPTKPKVTQREMRHKKYIPDYKTNLEKWVESTHNALQVLRDFVAADEEERDRIIESSLADRYPNRENELAEIEKRKEWNKDNPRLQWGDKTTPNPLWITYEVMERLGLEVGDKLDIPYGILVANSSGTGYTLKNAKGERTYEVSPTTIDEGIDAIVWLAKVKRGDSDIQHPVKQFYTTPTKTEMGDTGRFKVIWGSFSRMQEREFDNKEDAEAFAAKKTSASVFPIREVTRRFGYKVMFRHPLTGEKFALSDEEFDTKDEALAYIDSNYETLNDSANEQLEQQRQKSKDNAKREITPDDVVKVGMSYKNGKWSYHVEIDKRYANNLGMPLILKDGFSTSKDAKTYRDAIKDEAFAIYKNYKSRQKAITYFDTGADSRIGEDYRGGKDVTAEDFMNAFGFRGVQFGNWTNQRDRQMAVNQAYDAFMDLAKLIGVSPRALSLNGELGIAFGARGVGGFAAHYEPGEIVINLTKTQGAGSLAHEWWHALDNYFARVAGERGGMVTDDSSLAMRPELREAYNRLVAEIRNSNYYKRSKDKGDYWGRMHEVTARLLAEWVDQELKSRGELNTFLSRGAKTDRVAEINYERYKRHAALAGEEVMPFEEFKKLDESMSGSPYPSKLEVERFSAAMRNIFDTIEEREDEETGNTILYRSGDEEVFFSNAAKAVEGIRQDRATPEQWLKMIEKAGGLKAAEDKWTGLSDWLKGQDKKSLTKEEVMDYIRKNQVRVEEVNYNEHIDLDNNSSMRQLREEFDDSVEKFKQEKEAVDAEMVAFNDEMYGKYGEGWSGKLSAADKERGEKLQARYNRLTDDPKELAFNEMVERYGDDFGMAFEVNWGNGKLEPQMDMYGDDISDAAKYFLQFEEQPINSTRLSYTTKGLENKKEIALTVPTVESWNESDEIHFGDAGGGRAVAWVRFGDTEIPRKDPEARKRFDDAEKAWDDFGGRMYDKYGASYSLYLNEAEKAENSRLQKEYEEAMANYKEANNPQRVLVIDEIQSKRHQEGRERGYRTADSPVERRHRATEAMNDYRQKMQEKYGDYFVSDDMSPEEKAEYDRLYQEMKDAMAADNDKNKSYDIPEAPFEKNWHELAMKRMLRYAAENGYDKIAWTKGEQQAERYSLSKVFNSVEREDNPSIKGRRFVLSGGNVEDFIVDDNGKVIDSTINDAKGKNLSELVGKDMAVRLMALENGDMVEGEDLRIGGEGMKGFYDQILPRFMDKYGKKWGVKTGEVELPNVEKSARKMWAVDVTPEMKESVMQGQPMFREGEAAPTPRRTQRRTASQQQQSKAYAQRQWQRAHVVAEEAIRLLGLEDRVTVMDFPIGLTGRKAKAKGWYDTKTGKIVVVLNNHRSPEDVFKTILHEGVAHYGLRQLFGEHFDTFLDEVYTNATPEIRAAIDRMIENSRQKNEQTARREATEEYLALLAEDTDFDNAMRSGWWQKIKNAFLDMLHKLGFGEYAGPALTDNELRYILWRSHENLQDMARVRDGKQPLRRNVWNPFKAAEDIVMQEKLQVGNFSPTPTLPSREGEEPTPNPSLKGRAAEPKQPAMRVVSMEPRNEAERSYVQFKERYGDAVLLMNDGDNYFALGEDALKMERLLSNRRYLHGRMENGRYVLPLDELDMALPVLVRAGNRIAISDTPDSNTVHDGEPDVEWQDGRRMIERLAERYNSKEPVFFDLGMSDEELFDTLSFLHPFRDELNNEEDFRDFMAFVREKLNEDKGQAFYNVDSKKIFIFADRLKPKKAEEVFFHENIHGVLHDWYGDGARTIADRFWNIAPEKGKTSKSHVTANYDAGEQHEELFTYWLAKSMVDGSVDDMLNMFADADKQRIENILKTIGYDRERETEERKPRGTEDVSERAGGESLQGLQVQEGLDNRLRFRSGDETASYDHVMQEGFTQLREAWQDSMISVRELQRAILRARSEEKDWNTDKNYFEDAYNAENRMHGISRNEDEYYKRNLFDPMMDAFHDFMRHFELSETEAVRYMVSKTGLERNQFYAFSHGAEQKAKEIIEKKKAELKQQLDDGTIDSKEYLKKQRELDDSLRDEARKIIAAFKDDHEVMRLKDDYQRGIITYAEMLQRLEEIRKSYVKRENPKTDDDGNIVSDNYYDENVRDYSGLSGLLGGERLAEIRAMQDIARSIVDKEKAREMWATINDMIRELYKTTTEEALRTVDAVEVDEDLKERRDNGQIGLIPYLRETEERRKEYSRLWDKINASNAWTLKKSYDSGLLSRNNYEYIKGMFDFYMPLRGWDGTEAHDEYDYVDSPGTAYSPTVVKTHGRLSAADNPLAYIRSMATSAIVSGNKNVMKEHFRRFVMNHPSQLVTLDKQWYERIGTNADGEGVWVARYPDIPENATADEVASIVEAFTEEMRLKAKDGDATQHKGNLRVQYPQTRAEAKEHHVEVVFNGETYVLYINGDPRAAQALNGTRRREAQRRAGESSRAAAFGRWLAANYTSKSPSFTIANLARDITMATAVAAVKENPAYERQLIANLMKLLVPRASKGGAMMPSLMHKYLHGTLDMDDDTERYFYEFMTNGGETGFTALQDIDDIKKLMEDEFKKDNRRQLDPRRALSALGEFLEYANRCVEDLTRFATYMASREAGRGVAQSVSDAKNITLNFNRKGTGEKGNATMRNLYVFVNPAVQSLQLLGYLGKHFPKAFTLVTCSWVAAGVLTPLLNELIVSMFGGDDDKEVYWSLPDYVRRQNFCLYIPWGVKRFIQIPLAQEFRVFYGLGEAATTFFTGHADFWDSAGDIGKQFLDLLPLDFTGSGGNPVASLMPSAVKPVTDVAFNTSFTGYPIWKDTPWNQDEPAFQKAYSRTPSFLVSASQLINDWTGGNEHLKGVWENTTLGKYANNPAVVQHLMAGYFGGMYTFLTEGGGTLWTIIHGKMPQDMQVPVYNRFINNPKDRTQSGGIRMGDAYWKLMNESKETDSMFRGFKKDTQSQDEAVRKRGEEITAMKDAIEKKAKADSKGEDFESPVKIDKKLERRWLRSQTIKEYNRDIDKQKDMIERHVENDSIVVQAEANIKAIEAEMVSVLKGM